MYIAGTSRLWENGALDESTHIGHWLSLGMSAKERVPKRKASSSTAGASRRTQMHLFCFLAFFWLPTHTPCTQTYRMRARSPIDFMQIHRNSFFEFSHFYSSSSSVLSVSSGSSSVYFYRLFFCVRSPARLTAPVHRASSNANLVPQNGEPKIFALSPREAVDAHGRVLAHCDHHRSFPLHLFLLSISALFRFEQAES